MTNLKEAHFDFNTLERLNGLQSLQNLEFISFTPSGSLNISGSGCATAISPYTTTHYVFQGSNSSLNCDITSSDGVYNFTSSGSTKLIITKTGGLPQLPAPTATGVTET